MLDFFAYTSPNVVYETSVASLEPSFEGGCCGGSGGGGGPAVLNEEYIGWRSIPALPPLLFPH